MAFVLRSLIGAAALTASVALLAPAGEARAAAPCAGPAPVAGVEIKGPVLHVIDGSTLCVALGFEPDTWIPLRLADEPHARPLRKASAADAPPRSRGVLMEAAFARMAVCRTVEAGDGGVAAVCEVEGKPLGPVLDDPQVIAASQSWR
jgi:hypothetical protein